MLHSKMYGQPLGLAQSSGRSSSITFLCVSVWPFLNICSHAHHWWWSEFKHLHLALLKFHKGISCPPPHCSMTGVLNFSSQPIVGYTDLVFMRPPLSSFLWHFDLSRRNYYINSKNQESVTRWCSISQKNEDVNYAKTYKLTNFNKCTFFGVLELLCTCTKSNGYDFKLQISVTSGCVVHSSQ